MITETFRFDPCGRVGVGFTYCVEESSPFIVVEGVEGLLRQYRDLFMDNDVFKRDVLLEVTADIHKTTKDYRPSIRFREGDAPGKYVERYETWIVTNVHEVKAVLKPKANSDRRGYFFR